MKKKVIKTTITAVVLVVAVGAGSFWGYKKYVKAESTKNNQSYMAVKATKGNISINVTASGTVSCPVQTDVLAGNTGTIESLFFKEGDAVKAGTVIAKIKDTNAEQAVQTAQSTVNKENVNMANLKKNLDAKTIKSPVTGTILNVYAVEGDDASSVNGVYKCIVQIQADGLANPVSISTGNGNISKIYVAAGARVNKGDSLYRLNDDDVKAQMDSETVALQQAQNDLTNKKANLDKTSITSPIDGIIVTQTLKVGDSIASGKVVATVVDPNQMQTIVPVDELDIQKLKTGMKATVSLDAITGKSFDGEVTKISSVGKTTNSVTTYDVTVAIKNPENVKVGMTSNVNIQLQGKDNVVMLSATAVQGRGNNRYVILGSAVRKYAVTDAAPAANQSNRNNNSNNNNSNGNNNSNRPNNNQGGSNASRTNSFLVKAKILAADLVKDASNIKQVQVGLSDGTNVEITSGLSEGEEVMIPIQNTTTAVTSQMNANQFMQGGFQGMPGGFQQGGNQQRQNQGGTQQRQTQTQTQGNR